MLDKEARCISCCYQPDSLKHSKQIVIISLNAAECRHIRLFRDQGILALIATLEAQTWVLVYVCILGIVPACLNQTVTQRSYALKVAKVLQTESGEWRLQRCNVNFSNSDYFSNDPGPHRCDDAQGRQCMRQRVAVQPVRHNGKRCSVYCFHREREREQRERERGSRGRERERGSRNISVQPSARLDQRYRSLVTRRRQEYASMMTGGDSATTRKSASALASSHRRRAQQQGFSTRCVYHVQ